MLSRMHDKQLGTALRQDQRKKVDELRSSEEFDTLSREPEQNILPKRQIYYVMALPKLSALRFIPIFTILSMKNSTASTSFSSGVLSCFTAPI